VKNPLSRMCVYMTCLRMNSFSFLFLLFFFSIFYPCQDAYFFTSTFFIFFLPGVKWESGNSIFSESCTIFFFIFYPWKDAYFLTSTLFICFLPGVKQESKKFIVKNVCIHDVLQNELFFFLPFFTPVKMRISSLHSFSFFSC
jgi:hypothetical protein